MRRSGWAVPLFAFLVLILPSFSTLQDSGIILHSGSEDDPWEYIHSLDSGADDHGYGIAVDSSGNTYVTGSFSGENITFGATTLTNTLVGTSDVFIAKLSESGLWSWALSAGGISNDWGADLTVATTGEIYVTGAFTTTPDDINEDGRSASFGPDELIGAGEADIFVVKISNSGTWEWALAAGGEGEDIASGITLDDTNLPYISGSFTGTWADFDGTNLSGDNGIDHDLFVARLTPTGFWVWALEATGDGDQVGQSIAIDSSGNAYVTGFIEGNSTFDSTLTQCKGKDVFIAKVNNGGTWGWVEHIEGDGDDYGRGLAIDSEDGIHITGQHSNYSQFGMVNLTAGFGPEVFVAKISNTGTWQWAVTSISSSLSLEGEEGNEAKAIGIDASGDLHITGTFQAQMTLGTMDLISKGHDDVFIAKLNDRGSWLSSSTAGGLSNESANDIAVDSSGVARIIGDIDLSIESADFGQFSLSPSGSSSDIFLTSTWADTDEDGIRNSFDDCPTVPGTSDKGGIDGCPDVDGDGWDDDSDEFKFDSSQWNDSDDDGYGDNWADSLLNDSRTNGTGQWVENASNVDHCPEYGGTSTIDRLGCLDTDGDGVSDPDADWNVTDGADAFANDSNHSSDLDLDGIPDGLDECPSIAGNSTGGCLDSDGDSIPDSLDDFPLNASEWSDSDNDGYGDNSDAYPENSAEWADTDGDGFGDNIDSFPTNSTEWSDKDLDGVGDNADAFPTNSSEWMDSDADGFGDNADAFPFDMEEWSDLDMDGIGDNGDEFPLSNLGDLGGDVGDVNPNATENETANEDEKESFIDKIDEQLKTDEGMITVILIIGLLISFVVIVKVRGNFFKQSMRYIAETNTRAELREAKGMIKKGLALEKIDREKYIILTKAIQIRKKLMSGRRARASGAAELIHTISRKSGAYHPVDEAVHSGWESRFAKAVRDDSYEVDEKGSTWWKDGKGNWWFRQSGRSDWIRSSRNRFFGTTSRFKSALRRR